MFDFNLPGGKLEASSLHLAVISNNIKVIEPILASSEELNPHAQDNEGRKAKDLCPYNSPIYKIL